MEVTPELRSPLLPALTLIAAALFLCGGSGDAALPWLGAAALLLVLVFLATQAPPGGLLVLSPLAGLAAWCAVSIAWSIEPDRSWAYANRTVVYFAFALVGTFLSGRVRSLFFGMCALLGAVCVWSLAGKVFPWLYEDYGRIARLRGPVGYWNSLALLGDIALPLGLCLATRMRIPGTLLVYGWIVAIGLTYSRGGVLVAVVVFALWVALSRAWVNALTTLVAAGLPAAGALIVAFSLSGVTSDAQSHTTRVRDGLLFGAVLLLDAAIAAAFARLPPPEPTPAVRKATLGMLALAVAAAIVVGALHAHSLRDAFSSSNTTEISNSSSRFGQAGSNFRSVWWRQAWDGWKDARLNGTGAGSFEFTNLRLNKTSLTVAKEPHDLPLQFLSETGIVGLALFAGSIGWLIVVARRHPGPQLALALALPAYFLHGLLDYDWDFAAVSAPVFLIAGALAARPSDRRALSPFAVLMASGAAVAVVLSLFAVWLGARWTGQAQALLGVDNAKALTLAKRARSANPLAADPLITAGNLELAAGAGQKLSVKAKDYSLAFGFFEKATEVQPKNAQAWFALGDFNLNVRNCPRAALPQLSRFTVLDGQNSGNVEYAAALKLVNSGTPTC